MGNCERQWSFFKGVFLGPKPLLTQGKFLITGIWVGGQKRKTKGRRSPRQPEQGLSRTTPTLDFELQLALPRCYQFKKKKKRYLKWQ